MSFRQDVLKPVGGLIWEYVGFNISFWLLEDYDRFVADPEAYLERLPAESRSIYHHITDCVRFYEPGLLWLRTLPAHVEYLWPICSALKQCTDGNIGYVKKYWAFASPDIRCRSDEALRYDPHYNPAPLTYYYEEDEHRNEFELLGRNAIITLAAISGKHLPTIEWCFEQIFLPCFPNGYAVLWMHLASNDFVKSPSDVEKWKTVLRIRHTTIGTMTTDLTFKCALLHGNVHAARNILTAGFPSRLGDFPDIFARHGELVPIDMLKFLHEEDEIRVDEISVADDCANRFAVAQFIIRKAEDDGLDIALNTVCSEEAQPDIRNWHDSVIQNGDAFWVEIGL